MSMSRRDFTALAAILARQHHDLPKGEYEQGEEIMRRVLAREIAKVCAEANPAFDTERFLAAAKVTGRGQAETLCPLCAHPRHIDPNCPDYEDKDLLEQA